MRRMSARSNRKSTGFLQKSAVRRSSILHRVQPRRLRSHAPFASMIRPIAGQMFGFKLLPIFCAAARGNRASFNKIHKNILDRNFTELLVADISSGVMTDDRVQRPAQRLLSLNSCDCGTVTERPVCLVLLSDVSGFDDSLSIVARNAKHVSRTGPVRIQVASEFILHKCQPSPN